MDNYLVIKSIIMVYTAEQLPLMCDCGGHVICENFTKLQCIICNWTTPFPSSFPPSRCYKLKRNVGYIYG